MASRWTVARNVAVVLGTSVFACGCYSYVPANFTTIPPGEGVRVYLSQAGVDSLRHAAADALPDIGDRPVVSGRLVRRGTTDFSLQIPVATRQAGFHQAELDQQVTLPVADVVQVEAKRLSGVRTGLATVLATATLATVVVTILTGARQPVSTDGGGGVENLRLP